MVVRALPLEVVILVVAAAVPASSGRTVDRRFHGHSFSLVCKAWRPLGQHLLYEQVELDSAAKAKSFISHLNKYPHLGKGVRRLFVDSSPNGNSEVEDVVDTAALWRVLPSLQVLAIQEPEWFPVNGGIPLGIGMHLLQHFQFDPHRSDEKVGELLLLFIARCPRLNGLDATILFDFDLLPPSLLPANTPSLPPLQLQQLQLKFGVNRGEPQVELTRAILDRVNPAGLVFCALQARATDLAFVDFVFSFPALMVVTLLLEREPAVGTFVERVVLAAGRHGRQKMVAINVMEPFAMQQSSYALRLSTGSAITDLLAIIPPVPFNLQLTGMHLTDAELPPVPDYVRQWAQPDLMKRCIAHVECGIVDADEDEEDFPPIRTMFGHLEHDGMKMWMKTAELGGAWDDDSEEEGESVQSFEDEDEDVDEEWTDEE
jgi:hypothetical protein